MTTINIGYSNFVNADHVVAIVSPESAPIKRMVQEAKDSGCCVDATYGHRTRAVLVMDNGAIVLSAVQPATIINRNGQKEDK